MAVPVKHTVFKLATVLAVVGAMALSGTLPAHAATQGRTVSLDATLVAGSAWRGCPYGAVCIYQDAVTDHLSAEYITNTFWTYGAHNLVNQFNMHWVLNNQYGGLNATAVACYGYGGGNCTGDVVYPQTALTVNLTPINSIVLNEP